MSHKIINHEMPVRRPKVHRQHKPKSSTSRMAKSALDKAQEVGTDAASTITSQVKSLLDDKVNDGADIVGHVASSAHSAAEILIKILLSSPDWSAG